MAPAKESNTINSREDESSGRRRGFRYVAEWIAILSIPIVLYATGWHTEVSGRLQQAVLWTGLIQPDINLAEEEQQQASYDMPLVSLQGNRTNLSAFKGKVIFLNFWATWCPPCIAEMPNIHALHKKLQSNDEIVFVMVSLDENAEKARRFIASKGFSFPIYRPGGRRPPVFQSTTIPTTYVIDKKGFIVSEKQGMANYNTADFYEFMVNLGE